MDNFLGIRMIVAAQVGLAWRGRDWWLEARSLLGVSFSPAVCHGRVCPPACARQQESSRNYNGDTNEVREARMSASRRRVLFGIAALPAGHLLAGRLLPGLTATVYNG